MLLLSRSPFYSHTKQIFMHFGQYLCASYASRNGSILIFLNSDDFSIFVPSRLVPSLSPAKISQGSQAWTHSFSRLLHHSVTSQSHRFYLCNDFITSTLILSPFLKFYFIFNWGLITLQYCDGYCHTSTRISHRCTSHLPPHPFPLFCQKGTGFGCSVSYSERPLAICFTYGNVYVSILLLPQCSLLPTDTALVETHITSSLELLKGPLALTLQIQYSPF